jgi:hypothetical protein
VFQVTYLSIFQARWWQPRASEFVGGGKRVVEQSLKQSLTRVRGNDERIDARYFSIRKSGSAADGRGEETAGAGARTVAMDEQRGC